MTTAPRPPAPPRLSATERPSLAEAPEEESRIEGATYGAVDLSGHELTLVDWEECELAGTRLSGTHWVRCTLRDCVLRDCDLANTTWEQVGIQRTSIERTRLTGLNAAAAMLQNVTFGHTQGNLSSWRSARLERVVFDQCRLTQADFGGAQLTDVVFEGCDLSNADFSQCRLRSPVLFRGCRYDGLRGLDGLRGATVDSGDLYDLSFQLAAQLGITVAFD